MEQGILIFTDKWTLEHKKRDGLKSEGGGCYWETARKPKKFIKETLTIKGQDYDEYIIKRFPLYFAINGKIKGYFIIHEITDSEEYKNKVWLEFHSESWKEIKDGEVLKPSQGWRYYPKTGGHDKKRVLK